MPVALASSVVAVALCHLQLEIAWRGFEDEGWIGLVAKGQQLGDVLHGREARWWKRKTKGLGARGRKAMQVWACVVGLGSLLGQVWPDVGLNWVLGPRP